MAVPLKNILDLFLARQNNWQLSLLQNWPTIIGSIKTRVELLKIYDDTLVIGVLDSCWLQELYLLTPLLLQTINEKLDQPRIKKLRFKSLGIIDKPVKKETLIKKTSTKKVILNAQDQEILANVQDEQLRKVLKDYLVRCYQEQN